MAARTVTVDGCTFNALDLRYGRVRWWWLPRRRAAFRKGREAELALLERETAENRERWLKEEAAERRRKRKAERREAFRTGRKPTERRAAPETACPHAAAPTDRPAAHGGGHHDWPGFPNWGSGSDDTRTDDTGGSADSISTSSSSGAGSDTGSSRD